MGLPELPKRLSDNAETIGGFRQSIALIDGDANSPKEFGKIFRERRTAGTNQADTSTCAETNFFVNERVR